MLLEWDNSQLEFMSYLSSHFVGPASSYKGDSI